MIKRETLYIVALIAFGLGFVGGIVFSAVKTVPVAAVPGQPAPAQPDMAEAISKLEQVVAQEPGNYEAWVRLGNKYFDTAQHEKAIVAYDQALAINNGSPDVWTDLGIMYRRTGRFDQAIESFDEAARRSATHTMSRFNKGIVLLHDLNDRPGAVTAWEEVLSIDPTITLQDGRRLSDWVAELKAGS